MATEKISYLIIGGCGFLGFHIVSQLLDTHSAHIAVLDLRTDLNRQPGVRYFNGDITAQKDVSKVLDEFKPAVIIHTASPAALGDNRALFDKVNIGGTRNLVECCAQSDSVKAFVYTSSSSVVFDMVSDVYYADESFPVLEWPKQRSYYSHTKGVAEGIALAANGKNSMLTVALRPAGIFGERDPLFIPGLLNTYYTGKTKVQLGNNKSKWDATYVGNVAHAHLLAARALLQTQTMDTKPLSHEKIDGEAFFVTNDEPMPFWDIARSVWREAGWKGKAEDAWVMPQTVALVLATIVEWVYWILFFGSKEPVFKRAAVQQTCINRTFNISKAKRRLGYMPLVGMQEAIKKTVSDFEARKHEKEKAETKKSK